MTEILAALERLYALARDRVRARVVSGGELSPEKLDHEQLATHALAYLATEIEAARQITAWLPRAKAEGGGVHEERIAKAYVAELARELRGGVSLGQTENVALADLGLGEGDVLATIGSKDIASFIETHASGGAYLEIARGATEKGAGALGLCDDALCASQKEFRRFTDREVVPIAHEIHAKDVLIPMELVRKLAALGVFGLTISEKHGGLGLGKVAMCVVTEELSRGSLGVGSLATRAEIAAELVAGGGTEAQKREWLPRIASGEVLPTAVFTEPNFGSDLAHVQTRARREGAVWRIHGQKTWITHATRADLMTILARTGDEPGYGGLSVFLAKKTRTDAGFVDPGLTGTEIKVLGYRGMKEYELAFDGFAVDASGLLGGAPGHGFKQLMATFESARIQTAARAVGVAQAALDQGLAYAQSRVQFGRPIFDFPRVARKIGRIACRVQAARQLAHFAARMKDGGKRCDLEAGMAKLLATRAAWEAADACVQIHGGNGYAEEYAASRLLVDARVLSIFEGANEIQAHVVARRLLEAT